MRTLLIATIAVVAFASPSLANEFPFQPTRNPFLPFLTEDKDSAICASFLETLTAAFKGPRYDVDRGGWDWRGARAEWVFPVGEPPQPGVAGMSLPFGSDVPPPLFEDSETGTSVYSLAADIDGDGKQEALAMSRSLFNWTGNNYALMLFPSQDAFDAAIKTAKFGSDLFAKAVDLEADLGQAPFFLAKSTFSFHPPFALVRLNGDFYSLGFPTWSDDRYTISRVVAKSRPALVCSAMDVPTSDGWQRRLAGDAVARLIEVLRSISGTEEYSGGTGHWQSRLLIDAAAVETRMVLRPWVLDQVAPHGTRTEVERGLAGWGEADLYNHRQWRALKEIEPTAVDALTGFYADGYGLPAPDASRAAKSAVDLLVRAYFTFPSGGIEPKPDTAYRRLTRALLQDAPRGTILDLLKSGAKIRTQATSGSDQEPGEPRWGTFIEEPTLFYALENPGNVAVVLDAGADPNVKGNFDKNALMYAAQFDLLESAKVLLIYGANPNAATADGQGFETALERNRRTALMYAAENASPDLIRLLLSRGADPTVADTSERGVLDYLAWNKALSPEERAAITAELVKAGAEPPKP